MNKKQGDYTNKLSQFDHYTGAENGEEVHEFDNEDMNTIAATIKEGVSIFVILCCLILIFIGMLMPD